LVLRDAEVSLVDYAAKIVVVIAAFPGTGFELNCFNSHL